MANLTGQTPSATYKSLLNVGTGNNQELDGTLRVIEDGAGNDSSLKLTKTSNTYGASFVGRVGIGTDTPDVMSHIKDSGNELLRLESSDAGVSGANIRLYHNSASPADNDELGRIIFSGDDDSAENRDYAKITAISTDVSNDSKDGKLVFETMQANTSTISMTIDSGRVGIGTSVPGYHNLNVTGNPGANSPVVYIESTRSTSGQNKGLKIKAGSDGNEYTLHCIDESDADVFYVGGDGKVGIGLTPTVNMSGLSIESGIITIKETTTPTADTNYGKVYTKSDNKLYFQDGAGTEHEISFV